jgi:hypothetical protein
VIAKHRVATARCWHLGEPGGEPSRVVSPKAHEITTQEEQIGSCLNQPTNRLVDDFRRCHRTSMEIRRKDDSQTICAAERTTQMNIVLVDDNARYGSEELGEAGRPRNRGRDALRAFPQPPPDGIVADR